MATLKFKSRLLKTLQNVNTNILPEESQYDDALDQQYTPCQRQSDRRPKFQEQTPKEEIASTRTPSRHKADTPSQARQTLNWSSGIQEEFVEDKSFYYTPCWDISRDGGLEAIRVHTCTPTGTLRKGQTKSGLLYVGNGDQGPKVLMDKSMIDENQNYYSHNEMGPVGETVDYVGLQAGQGDVQNERFGNHPAQSENQRIIGECLYSMWQAQKMCDVVLKVDGQVFPTHKLALAAHSDEFASKHCSQGVSQVIEIDFPRGSAESLKEILKFVYTSEIDINSKNLHEILMTAKQLGIRKVIEQCEGILLNFNIDNVLDLIEIAKKQEMFNVVSEMENFISKRFTDITKTEHFLQCSVNEVCRMLNDDSLLVSRELDVFSAARRWIEYNRSARLKYADDVLKSVRMIYISPEELVTRVEPDMIPTMECQQMLMNVYRFQALKLSGSHLIDNDHHPNARWSYRPTEYIAAIQEQGHPERPFSSGKAGVRLKDETYAITSPMQLPALPDVNTHITNQHCVTQDSNPLPRSGGADISVKRSTRFEDVNNDAINFPRTSSSSQVHVPIETKPQVIISIGGIDPFHDESNMACQLVKEFNLSTNSWRVVTELPEPRHHHGAVVLKDLIYVIGGSTLEPDASESWAHPTNACYTYNYRLNIWRAIASMSTRRMYHAVAVLGGVLYAIGGENDRGETLDTVEFYNPQTNLWGRACPMSDCKIGISAISHNGLVFVMGGYMETAEEKVLFGTVECYNPRRNRWTVKNPLPQPVCHSGVVEINQTLYLVGGSTFCEKDNLMPSIGSVFRYDDLADRWDVITTLRVPRHDAGIASAGDKIVVVGGLMSPMAAALADVEVFDVSSNKWLTGISQLSTPVLGITCNSLAGSCVDKT